MDQWGNIISGVDLIRRLNQKQAFGITSHLITNNDGSKMGKTADGAIWLDENKLSNFEFFQFWRNTDDENVSKFLNLFTKLQNSEIEKLSELKGKEINVAKETLAFEVTKMVRGEKAATDALEIANNVFGSKKIDDRLNKISVNINNINDKFFTILDAIEKLDLVGSRSEIKRLIKSNGIKVNDTNYNEVDYSLLNLIKIKKLKSQWENLV